MCQGIAVGGYVPPIEISDNQSVFVTFTWWNIASTSSASAILVFHKRSKLFSKSGTV